MSTIVMQEALPRVHVWGLPLAPLSFDQTLNQVEGLIRSGKPHYFITANVHYAMLARQDPSLAEVTDGAAFLVADGMPLVWASRWKERLLPERVAGADLIPALCERAARKGYRVFLLGGAPGVGAEAARRLCRRYHGLQIVGVESPPFRPLSQEEQKELAGRVRAAHPDLLFVALGQPRGERWLADNLDRLGQPVCVQIGAALDFLAGRVPRAPRWLQQLGLEWTFRLAQEPGRLLSRYTANGWFILKMLTQDLLPANGRGEKRTA